ncbi:MAG: ogr/Delta-like zinc finger family protein [Methylobacter sp.]
MRVICPFCSKKAVIGSSNPLNDDKTIHDLYCRCTNVQTCGATFVYTLAYNHVLNPPLMTSTQIALELVNRLSKEEKAVLQRDMFA